MKTAVVYFSKTGASAECARELYRLIPGAELFNLAVDKCDLSAFDNVILGGGIRAGRAPSKLLKFVTENLLELQKKNIGLFVCCSDEEHRLNYIESNFPAVLVKKAIASDGFGAKMDPAEMKGLDRFVAKIAAKNMKKAGLPMPTINKTRIAEFAKKFI